MPIRRSARAHTNLTSASSKNSPRRAASGSTVKISNDEPNSPDESKKALRLTMKMPASKLREATSSHSRPGSRGNPASQLTDSLTKREMVSGPRASRANKKYVVESESEDESDDDDEEAEIQASDVEEEDEEGEDEEEEDQVGGPKESDDEAEEEEEEEEEEEDDPDVDADGDIEMEDEAEANQLPPAPVLKVKGPTKPAPKQTSSKPSKPTVTVTPADSGRIKSVEAKEMELDDDDEELSELSDDDEDAEGEADEEAGDEDSRSPGSRGSTPDLSKMTKRQRSRLDQVVGADFLQLPMGMYLLVMALLTELY